MTLLRRSACPILICAFVVCFFWKLVVSNQYTWLQSPDFASQLLPWYQFQAGEWHAGRIPLWTPYEWAGQSLIGQAQPGVFDPFNLLLYAAPLKNGWLAQWALHWFFVVGYIASALAFYAFARRALRLSRPASMVAALGYSVGGIAGSTTWPQMTHATIWAPLALLFQFRAARERSPIRDGALSGAMLGLMWLSGHHQIPIYFALAAAALWIHLLYARFATKPGILRAAAAAGLFLFLFGALQILPAAEYGQHAIRWVGSEDAVGWADKIPYKVHQQFSMRPMGLLSLFIKTNESYEPFMGMTLMTLAALGAAAAWRANAPARWLVSMGCAAALFALGANGFLHGPLYALLPMLEKARVPAVAMVLFNFAAAALAGYGVDAMAANPALTRKFARAAGALAALMILTAAVVAFRSFEWRLAAFGCSLAAILFYLRPRFAPVLLAAGILFELSHLNGADWQPITLANRNRFADELALHADIAQFLQQAPGHFRTHYTFADIVNSFGDWWGIETVEALAASAPAAYFRLDPFHPAIQRLAGVRYHIGRKPERDGLVERFRGASGLNVYEDVDAFPRAWLVHKVRSVAGHDEAERWLKNGGGARRAEAVVYGPAPSVEACDSAEDEVEFESRAPRRLALRVHAACDAFLVLNDNWFPGWRATIDGEPAPVQQADGFMRGVKVPGGAHRIHFIFQPRSVALGAGCLFLGLAGVAILLLTRGGEA